MERSRNIGKEDIVLCRRRRFVHIPIPNPAVAWSCNGMAVAGTLFALLAVSGCVEPYPIWKKLEHAPFPVTVDSLVTKNRHFLNRQHALTYEGWRVGFGPGPPTAIANAN